MALLDINWNLDKKQLRIFLLLLVVFACVVAAITYNRTASPSLAAAIVGVAVVVAVIGVLVPPLSRVLYVVWMGAAFPIGWTVSHLVMAVVYYLVVTPIGLTMRLLGHDPMQRKFDPQAKTYWREHRSTEEVSRYFRQF